MKPTTAIRLRTLRAVLVTVLVVWALVGIFDADPPLLVAVVSVVGGLIVCFNAIASAWHAYPKAAREDGEGK